MVKMCKKVWECDPCMGHRRQWRIYHFHQIHEVLLFPLPLWAILSHSAPSPQALRKMVLPDILHCRIIHRHARKLLKTYSDSSFLCASDVNNFNFLSLFWAEQSSFKDAETIQEEHFCARNCLKPLGSFFRIKMTIT